MIVRISIFDLLVLVALVAGLTAYFWSGWSRRQLEPRNRVMRQAIGEVTITSTNEIHAIHKPQYSSRANLIEWDVYLPSGEFRICFGNVAKPKTTSKVESIGPVRAFPLENGRHQIVVKWLMPKPDSNPEAQENRFQQVEILVDGKSVGEVENRLPMSAMQVFGNPVPSQHDISPSLDTKLQLARFQSSENSLMPYSPPCWMVWIEPVK